MKAVLIWCLLGGLAFGQLTIPDKVAPYEPIVAGCNCIIPKNGKAQFMWRTDAYSKSIQSDDTYKLYIWAAPGSHTAEVIVVVQTFKKVQVIKVDPKDPTNKDKWTLEEVDVVDSFDVQRYEKNYIVGDTPGPGPVPPGPPPGPGPGPGPTPPPNPLDEFATKCQGWLKAIPAANYSKDKANKVADNYSAVAAQAVATSGWNLSAFVDQTKVKNRETLTGDDAAAWGPAFFNPLAVYQAQLFAERKLTTSDVTGIAKLWNDTAEAIRKAAATTSYSQTLVPPLQPEKPVDSKDLTANVKRFSTSAVGLYSLEMWQVNKLIPKR